MGMADGDARIRNGGERWLTYRHGMEKGGMIWNCTTSERHKRDSEADSRTKRTSLTEFRHQMRSGDLPAYLSLNCPLNDIQ